MQFDRIKAPWLCQATPREWAKVLNSDEMMHLQFSVQHLVNDAAYMPTCASVNIKINTSKKGLCVFSLRNVISKNPTTCPKTAKTQEQRSVLEGSTAASSADKLLEHRSIHLPEGSSLSHLSQMVYTKPETKHFQVLEKKTNNMRED